MWVTGIIKGVKDGSAYIIAPLNCKEYIIQNNKITHCEVIIKDGRELSADQRRKLYALFRDVSLWTGYDPEYTKILFKEWFAVYADVDEFSLSDVDMTTANEFIEFILDFCVENNIPLSQNGSTITPNIYKYVYKCLCEKVCCVCGNNITRITDLHHVDHVGQGRNRREIDHIGMKAMSLCRQHHTECHTIGQTAFNEKYHVDGVKIDKVIADIYKI